jgi:NADPH:quinone reductase-like Zn-dependent oxidoreductase
VKPANLSFDQAAAVPVAGLTALQGLRNAEVTGVCSTGNVDMVRSFGADHVIDYTQDDFAQDGRRYDFIFQLAGTRSASECRPALTEKGTLVLSSGESSGRVIGPVGRVVGALALSPFVSQRLLSFTVKPNKEDLQSLKELIEGREVSPVVDRRYSLADAPEAIGYLEEGHARGKVVIGVSAA